MSKRLTPLANRFPRPLKTLVGSSIAFLVGCASPLASATRTDLDKTAPMLREPDVAPPALNPAGRLASYMGYALQQSPELRAAFARWKAATLDISRPSRLPEPMLSYGYFVRSVETRVGPQRHRFGLRQAFPWPTKLSAGSDAAAARARAAQRLFDAQLLGVRRRVEDAYWKLWLIQKEHVLKSEHDIVLETLAGTIRGRVETGKASLADLNHVELSIARHHDHHGQHREEAQAAFSELLGTIGYSLDSGTLGALPLLTDTPTSGRPDESHDALLSAARNHPSIEQHVLLEQAQEHMARAAFADFLPQFQLGVDYIETGAATNPIPDSGKDPIIVSGAVSLPLWWKSYDDAEEAAQARAQSHRLDRESAMRQAEASLELALAKVRDAQRRIELHRDTLIPQAETTFRSVLGSYQTGRSTVAAALLAQRDLLELQLGLVRAQAAHARSWAQLEMIAGRHVALASGSEHG